MSFDFVDFVFDDKHENLKRIQIRPSIKGKFIGKNKCDTSSMFNDYYSPKNNEWIARDEFDRLYHNDSVENCECCHCHNFMIRIKEEIGWNINNDGYQSYDINYIDVKHKKHNAKRGNKDKDESVVVTESSLRYMISQQTLTQPQKIHIYPLLNKYAMQRLVAKQQRDNVKMVYTTNLMSMIENGVIIHKHNPGNSIHEIYGDEIMKLCSIFSFISIFCRYDSSSKTHSDVINLCILYAGMSKNILPFADHNILSKLNDSKQYNKIRNNPIECFDFDIFDKYINNLSNGNKEIFICLLLDDADSNEFNERNSKTVLFKKYIANVLHTISNYISSIFVKPKLIKPKMIMVVNNKYEVDAPQTVKTIKMFGNLDNKCQCWCGCGHKIPGTHKGHKYNQLKRLRICVVHWNRNKLKVNPKIKPFSKTYVRKGWWHFHEQMTKIPVHKRGFSQIREDLNCGHGCCIHLRRSRGTVWKIIRLKQLRPGFLDYKRGVWYDSR